MPRISKATEYNWKKLNSRSDDKLTRRANKTLSAKHIVASSYLDNDEAKTLLAVVSQTNRSIECIMYSLVIACLKDAQIIEKPHVASFLDRYKGWESFEITWPKGEWNRHEDILGFIYQSLITEGERNLTGQYYTSKKVVEYVLDGMQLPANKTFLDPCCGSGAFLLGVRAENPSNLYGFDINPIAVLIASANLLVKYSDVEFTPNVYCLDFLQKDMLELNRSMGLPLSFDFVYTNPPWGSDREGKYVYHSSVIQTKEKASMVIAKALACLETDATSYFLLPSSLLRIRTHHKIRRKILAETAVRRIDLFRNRFDGVYTDYFGIELSSCPVNCQRYQVTSDEATFEVELAGTDRSLGNIVVMKLSEMDGAIMKKMESYRHDDLTHSRWALGIVTGDNKHKVKAEQLVGMEPVFRGKEVTPFNLQKESAYIRFAPESFQQCAKEACFRVPEKLIYRFIAKYPVVAYDDKQCICLNSANIVIPDLDGISVKSVAALLNSTLYRYYYSLKFADVKVLKGNLQELPFPKLTLEQDNELGKLVTSIQSFGYSEAYRSELDDYVYAIFDITPLEREYIESKMI